jgi:hypothetical protein
MENKEGWERARWQRPCQWEESGSLLTGAKCIFVPFFDTPFPGTESLEAVKHISQLQLRSCERASLKSRTDDCLKCGMWKTALLVSRK